MNLQNDENIKIRQDLLGSIDELSTKLEHEELPVLYKPDLLDILLDLKKMLSSNETDFDKLKKYNFAVFRTVTDDDFQHTPLGKDFLDFSKKTSLFIKKNTLG